MSLLSVDNVRHRYPTTVGELPVLDRVSLDVERESVVAVVGESGCGKTTLGRLIVGLVEPLEGDVRYEGTNIWHLPKQERQRYRRAVQLVHQDPYASLNPSLSVGESLKAGLLYHHIVSRREVRDELFRLLGMVGLETTNAFLRRYPHQLSGGQRQRVAIARAMSLRPRLVVADEAVSMLDVSVRVSVLDLLLSMRDEHQLAYVFISHDFGVVRYFAQGGRIVVMFFGVVVEEGPADEVIRHPRHPYTYLLLEAIPVPDPVAARRHRAVAGQTAEERITGEASAVGCVFCNRCPYTQPQCRTSRPPLIEVVSGDTGARHRAACWFTDQVPDLPVLEYAGRHEHGRSPAGRAAAAVPGSPAGRYRGGEPQDGGR